MTKNKDKGKRIKDKTCVILKKVTSSYRNSPFAAIGMFWRPNIQHSTRNIQYSRIFIFPIFHPSSVLSLILYLFLIYYFSFLIFFSNILTSPFTVLHPTFFTVHYSPFTVYPFSVSGLQYNHHFFFIPSKSFLIFNSFFHFSIFPLFHHSSIPLFYPFSFIFSPHS